jgi:hypothetical protein
LREGAIQKEMMYDVLIALAHWVDEVVVEASFHYILSCKDFPMREGPNEEVNFGEGFLAPNIFPFC